MESVAWTWSKLYSCLKCRSVDPIAIHGISVKIGYLCSTFLCNNLLNAYSLREMYVHVHKLFDEIPRPNSFTFSTMISCCTKTGNIKHAVALLKKNLHDRMDEYVEEGIDCPDMFTLGNIITGCGRAKDLRIGLQIHGITVKLGFEVDMFVSGTLIDMYGKCGKVDESIKVFKQTTYKDTVTWTTLITCLANVNDLRSKEVAFCFFRDMISVGVMPVGMTFVSIFKIFDEPKRFCQAKQIHGCMVKVGVQVDDLLGSSLLTMYGRCGGLDEVIRLSTRIKMDVVSYTSLLVAYMQNGYNMDAINIFRQMIEEKVIFDPFVITSAVRACSDLGELGMGEEIHCFSLRKGFLADISVANSLLTLYGRCSEIEKAARLFQLMKDKNIISWTALLTSYCQNGHTRETIFLFKEMLRLGISSPAYCISSAIRTCSLAANLSMGEQLYSLAVKTGFPDDLSTKNSLMIMYCKCGHTEVALEIFNSISCKTIVSWNALITALSQSGQEKLALELFDKMQIEGIQPDDYTFIGILVSCSRLGLVTEGCSYFKLMSEEYGVVPKIEHYACVVDLFGRAGKLYDAMDFIKAMPYEPDQVIWEALLASCTIHGDLELGKFVSKKILQIRSQEFPPYVMLSNLYASMGMWDKKASVQTIMKNGGLYKDPGISWVETMIPQKLCLMNYKLENIEKLNQICSSFYDEEVWNNLH